MRDYENALHKIWIKYFYEENNNKKLRDTCEPELLVLFNKLYEEKQKTSRQDVYWDSSSVDNNTYLVNLFGFKAEISESELNLIKYIDSHPEWQQLPKKQLVILMPYVMRIIIHYCSRITISLGKHEDIKIEDFNLDHLIIFKTLVSMYYLNEIELAIIQTPFLEFLPISQIDFNNKELKSYDSKVFNILYELIKPGCIIQHFLPAWQKFCIMYYVNLGTKLTSYELISEEVENVIKIMNVFTARSERIKNIPVFYYEILIDASLGFLSSFLHAKEDFPTYFVVGANAWTILSQIVTYKKEYLKQINEHNGFYQIVLFFIWGFDLNNFEPPHNDFVRGLIKPIDFNPLDFVDFNGSLEIPEITSYAPIEEYIQPLNLILNDYLISLVQLLETKDNTELILKIILELMESINGNTFSHIDKFTGTNRQTLLNLIDITIQMFYYVGNSKKENFNQQCMQYEIFFYPVLFDDVPEDEGKRLLIRNSLYSVLVMYFDDYSAKYILPKVMYYIGNSPIYIANELIYLFNTLLIKKEAILCKNMSKELPQYIALYGIYIESHKTTIFTRQNFLSLISNMLINENIRNVFCTNEVFNSYVFHQLFVSDVQAHFFKLLTDSFQFSNMLKYFIKLMSNVFVEYKENDLKWENFFSQFMNMMLCFMKSRPDIFLESNIFSTIFQFYKSIKEPKYFYNLLALLITCASKKDKRLLFVYDHQIFPSIDYDEIYFRNLVFKENMESINYDSLVIYHNILKHKPDMHEKEFSLIYNIIKSNTIEQMLLSISIFSRVLYDSYKQYPIFHEILKIILKYQFNDDSLSIIKDDNDLLTNLITDSVSPPFDFIILNDYDDLIKIDVINYEMLRTGVTIIFDFCIDRQEPGKIFKFGSYSLQNANDNKLKIGIWSILVISINTTKFDIAINGEVLYTKVNYSNNFDGKICFEIGGIKMRVGSISIYDINLNENKNLLCQISKIRNFQDESLSRHLRMKLFPLMKKENHLINSLTHETTNVIFKGHVYQCKNLMKYVQETLGLDSFFVHLQFDKALEAIFLMIRKYNLPMNYSYLSCILESHNVSQQQLKELFDALENCIILFCKYFLHLVGDIASYIEKIKSMIKGNPLEVAKMVYSPYSNIDFIMCCIIYSEFRNINAQVDLRFLSFVLSPKKEFYEIINNMNFNLIQSAIKNHHFGLLYFINPEKVPDLIQLIDLQSFCIDPKFPFWMCFLINFVEANFETFLEFANTINPKSISCLCEYMEKFYPDQKIPDDFKEIIKLPKLSLDLVLNEYPQINSTNITNYSREVLFDQNSRSEYLRNHIEPTNSQKLYNTNYQPTIELNYNVITFVEYKGDVFTYEENNLIISTPILNNTKKVLFYMDKSCLIFGGFHFARISLKWIVQRSEKQYIFLVKPGLAFLFDFPQIISLKSTINDNILNKLFEEQISPKLIFMLKSFINGFSLNTDMGISLPNDLTEWIQNNVNPGYQKKNSNINTNLDFQPIATYPSQIIYLYAENKQIYVLVENSIFTISDLILPSEKDPRPTIQTVLRCKIPHKLSKKSKVCVLPSIPYIAISDDIYVHIYKLSHNSCNRINSIFQPKKIQKMFPIDDCKFGIISKENYIDVFFIKDRIVQELRIDQLKSHVIEVAVNQNLGIMITYESSGDICMFSTCQLIFIKVINVGLPEQPNRLILFDDMTIVFGFKTKAILCNISGNIKNEKDFETEIEDIIDISNGDQYIALISLKDCQFYFVSIPTFDIIHSGKCYSQLDKVVVDRSYNAIYQIVKKQMIAFDHQIINRIKEPKDAERDESPHANEEGTNN